eukprot:1157640-Pelagomonas_calceolata.AAC.15
MLSASKIPIKDFIGDLRYRQQKDWSCAVFSVNKIQQQAGICVFDGDKLFMLSQDGSRGINASMVFAKRCAANKKQTKSGACTLRTSLALAVCYPD